MMLSTVEASKHTIRGCSSKAPVESPMHVKQLYFIAECKMWLCIVYVTFLSKLCACIVDSWTVVYVYIYI